jgi:CRP/FNR family transcriptional regulator, cyclic AMP receptor protein
MKLPQIFASPTNVRSYCKGTPIFKPATTPGRCSWCRAGRWTSSSKASLSRPWAPKGSFGEISLIEDSERSADAIARTDCKLLPVNRHHFLFMVDETPLFAIHVMRGMAERLRKAAKRAVE